MHFENVSLRSLSRSLPIHLTWSILLIVTHAYNISPLYLPPAIGSQSWYGSDGMWSAVTLRVGNPPQQVNVIPTTNTNDFWTVNPTGCDSETWAQVSNQTTPQSCPASRGGIFDPSKSSTWLNVTSALGFSEQRFFDMGLNVTVDYGTDSVRIGIDNSLVLEDYVVAHFADPAQFMTGILGLSVANVTFDQETNYRALLTTLYAQKKIPSQSWGYTAGAYYKEKRIPCSVVLGGYDLDRFVLHDRKFTLTPDLYATAGLQSIIANSSSANNETLLSDPIQVYIDSTTPYYYFPESVCNRFAEIFGLVYDSETELYFYASDDSYKAAKEADYLLSFKLTNNTDGSGEPVVLYLSFASFDLQHTFYNESSEGTTRPYFPIKRTSQEDSYTLGRAFLQETYLIVDYYRVTFSIHQAWFNGNTGAYQNVVTITDPATDDTDAVTTGGRVAATSLAPGELGSNPKISSGEDQGGDGGGGGGSNNAAIIGGAVAGGVVLLVLLGLAIFFIRRRRRQRDTKAIAGESSFFPSGADLHEDSIKSPVAEDADPAELVGQTSPRYELPTEGAISPQEMEAEVPIVAIPPKSPPELDAVSTSIDPSQRASDRSTMVSSDISSPVSPQSEGQDGFRRHDHDDEPMTPSLTTPRFALPPEGIADGYHHRHHFYHSEDDNGRGRSSSEHS